MGTGTATATATNDYLLSAVSGPAGGCGLESKSTEGQPAAKGRPAVSPWQVVIFCTCLTVAPMTVAAQNSTPVFTRADTMRGSNTPERAWWDAAFYDLHVKVNPADSSIAGYNAI